MTGIDNLIICNPYEEPQIHWRYDRSKKFFKKISTRRPAGFLIASAASKQYDDPGEFRELELVNRIRKRVDIWRSNNYPNVTGITKQLLDFWNDHTKRENRLFFCQLEAIETLIWLVEGSDSEKQGIKIPSDGGIFERLCCKMATGSGKTVVMAMLIAWQIINKITYPQDTRFSKNILIMAPGLTVKSRLQVLFPSGKNTFYDEFGIAPEPLYEKLLQGNIIIHNWHTMMPKEDAKNSVVKLGKESNNVFSKRILGHDFKNIIVINDEAHHAYRADKEQIKKITQTELERDKRWIEGLDKIHDSRNIVKCFDFSATPFIPSGKNVSEDTLFKWIVSDFSLNDAIESGLTKTPRIAIRDDSGQFDDKYRSKFYHLYNDDEVKPDLNRKSRKDEKLPDLVTNAYLLLGHDWLETKKHWDKNNSKIPPVMITVCNRTETAARIMHSFEKGNLAHEELSIPEHLLHIDSVTMDKLDDGSDVKTKNLREIADTVGKKGKPGEQIRNIVAVQMLSEGWDARNVTHIMGLRAFSSQLLCEQVVGRGLRRVSYEINPQTNLFSPEYVNVFGIPFTFLPHEDGKDTDCPPTVSTTSIEIDPDKVEHEISWPNIDRIDIDLSSKLSLDWENIKPLEISSSKVRLSAGMAQIIEGKPNVDKMTEIVLSEYDKTIRLQHIVFLAARDAYLEFSPSWKGTKEFLLLQVIKLVEKFIDSDKIIVSNASDSELRKKLSILFNMKKVVSYVCKSISDCNTITKKIMLNPNKPIKSTSDMRSWSTKRPAEYTVKTHINLSVYDQGWEISTGQELERNNNVISFVKNDHIGFVIKYLYGGSLHDYYPDFLIRLKNNVMLVLEIKGKDDDQNQTKRRFLKEWVDVVNDDGNYGTWVCDVAFHPTEVRGKIEKHSKSEISAKLYAKCPKCGKSENTRQDIEKKFGFCVINGIIKSQSLCKKCVN